jgi:hypothetical protein
VPRLLYRVVPWIESATPGHPGHPRFVPRSTGSSRIDNPGRYEPLYLGDTPAGAVAEAFGWASRWGPGLLRGTPSLPGSVRALVTYSLPDADEICDLDDAARLVELGIRPSEVVTRDRPVTQAWALGIFTRGGFSGCRWWSYYDSAWGSFGLWRVGRLRVRSVQPMTMEHPALREAADVLRRIVTS